MTSINDLWRIQNSFNIRHMQKREHEDPQVRALNYARAYTTRPMKTRNFPVPQSQGGQPRDYDNAIALQEFRIERENVIAQQAGDQEQPQGYFGYHINQDIANQLIKNCNALIREQQQVFVGTTDASKMTQIFKLFNDLSFLYNQQLTEIIKDIEFSGIFHTKLIQIESLFQKLQARFNVWAADPTGTGYFANNDYRNNASFSSQYISEIITTILNVIKSMLENKSTTDYYAHTQGELMANEFKASQLEVQPYSDPYIRPETGGPGTGGPGTGWPGTGGLDDVDEDEEDGDAGDGVGDGKAGEGDGEAGEGVEESKDGRGDAAAYHGLLGRTTTGRTPEEDRMLDAEHGGEPATGVDHTAHPTGDDAYPDPDRVGSHLTIDDLETPGRPLPPPSEGPAGPGGPGLLPPPEPKPESTSVMAWKPDATSGPPPEVSKYDPYATYINPKNKYAKNPKIDLIHDKPMKLTQDINYMMSTETSRKQLRAKTFYDCVQSIMLALFHVKGNEDLPQYDPRIWVTDSSESPSLFDTFKQRFRKRQALNPRFLTPLISATEYENKIQLYNAQFEKGGRNILGNRRPIDRKYFNYEYIVDINQYNDGIVKAEKKRAEEIAAAKEKRSKAKEDAEAKAEAEAKASAIKKLKLVRQEGRRRTTAAAAAAAAGAPAAAAPAAAAPAPKPTGIRSAPSSPGMTPGRQKKKKASK